MNLTHTINKTAFICDICKASLRRNDSLTRHIKKITRRTTKSERKQVFASNSQLQIEIVRNQVIYSKGQIANNSLKLLDTKY